jgi:hypothetical protein
MCKSLSVHNILRLPRGSRNRLEPVMGNPGLKEKTDLRFRRAWDGLLAMLEAYRSHGAPFGFAPDPRAESR